MTPALVKKIYVNLTKKLPKRKFEFAYIKFSSHIWELLSFSRTFIPK